MSSLKMLNASASQVLTEQTKKKKKKEFLYMKMVSLLSQLADLSPLYLKHASGMLTKATKKVVLFLLFIFQKVQEFFFFFF